MEQDYEVGQVLPCGVFRGYLPPKGKYRGRQAAVDCHCGTYFQCRATVLKQTRKGRRRCGQKNWNKP